MICDYGMIERCGKVVYPNREAASVENVIKDILDEQYAIVKEMLTENRAQLDLIALELLNRKTLTAEEVYQLLDQFDTAETVCLIY